MKIQRSIATHHNLHTYELFGSMCASISVHTCMCNECLWVYPYGRQRSPSGLFLDHTVSYLLCFSACVCVFWYIWMVLCFVRLIGEFCHKHGVQTQLHMENRCPGSYTFSFLFERVSQKERAAAGDWFTYTGQQTLTFSLCQHLHLSHMLLCLAFMWAHRIPTRVLIYTCKPVCLQSHFDHTDAADLLSLTYYILSILYEVWILKIRQILMQDIFPPTL